MKTIPKIAVSEGTSLRFLKPEDIAYCTAEGSYTRVHLADGTRVILSKNLKTIGSSLPWECFVRVHYSCIINLAHVVKYTNGKLNLVQMTDGEELPVSRNRKALLLKQFLKI